MAHAPQRPLVDELLAHAAGLKRLAIRLVGDGAADDLVQDTLLAGIEHPPRSAHAMRPWLARVMENLAHSRRRGESRRAWREHVAAREEALPSARDLVERMEMHRVVAEEVLALAEPYRGAVLAFYFDGVPAEEHAQKRGIPAATVRSHLKRGLDQLRDRLDARCGRSTWSAALLPLARPDALVASAQSLHTAASISKSSTSAASLSKSSTVATSFAMPATAFAALLVVAVSCIAWWLAASGSRADADASSTKLAQLPPNDARRPVARSTAATDDASAMSATSHAAREAVATIALERGGIVGHVTTGKDGPRAPGIGVGLIRVGDTVRHKPPLLVETDANGTFRFDEIAPGAYELQLDRCNPRVLVVVEAGKSANAALVVTGTPSIRGHVLDDEDRAVAGAEIWVWDPSSRISRVLATTDDDGAYEVRWVGRQCSMQARKRGYVASGLRKARETTPGSHDFVLAFGSGSLRGVVVDESGSPLPDTIVATRMPSASGVNRAGGETSTPSFAPCVTDASGAFSFDDLAAGANLVSVVAEGYAPFHEQTGIVAGGTTELRIVLARPVSVRGTVRDRDGKPLAGAWVDVRSGNGEVFDHDTSSADGTYRLTKVAAGRGRVQAELGSHDVASATLELAAGVTVWDPVLTERVTLRGRAIDENGLGLASHFVSVFPKPANPNSAKVETDRNGWFEIEGCADQPVDLRLFDAGNPPTTWATLQGVQPTSHDIVLQRADVPPLRIRGVLVDAQGAPRANAGVLAVQARGQTYAATNSDGAFECVDLVPGRVTLFACSPRAPSVAVTSIELGDRADVDLGRLQVPASGALRVRVRSESGAPVEWITAFLQRLDEPSQQVSSHFWNGRGEITAVNVTAGDYRLLIRGAACGNVHRLVRIDAGTTNDVDIVLRPGLRAQVVVVWPSSPRASREMTLEIRDAQDELVDFHRPSSFDPLSDVKHTTTLAPGRYTFEARTSDGLTGSAKVEVDERATFADVVEVRLR